MKENETSDKEFEKNSLQNKGIKIQIIFESAELNLFFKGQSINENSEGHLT